VLVCTGGVSEGPMDPIRGVLVRARKNYFGSVNLKKNDPMQILARGLGVCLSVVSERDLTSVGDRGRECRTFIIDKRRRR
jgi:hypothetical protein